MTIALLFITLFVCLFLTVPISISLALATFVAIATSYDTNMMNMLAQSMVTSVDNYALMAIPFFMLLGYIMEKAGIAASLIKLAEAIVGDRPGGLGSASVVACMFFAAISGSGPACVAAIGALLAPSMLRQGYDKGYTGALLASGSTIGPVIPPSIPMIVYGATVGVSITAMFAAGVLPGIMMGLALIIYNRTISKRRGYKGNPQTVSKLAVLKEAIWAVLMPLIVLGGIYAGIFTPTESAVIGVVYSIIVGIFVYKQLTWKRFLEGLLESAVMSASVMFVMGGASTFGRVLTLEHLPQLLTEFLTGVSSAPIVIMLIINGILLIAGMFIDTTSNIILFAPLFTPVVSAMGYNLVYFGLVMVVNLCIGMLTPPLGVNLFVGQAVAGSTFDKVVKEVVPMIIILVIVLIILIAVPPVSLLIPRLMGLVA